MKTLKLIQMIFLMCSLGACTRTKTRAKPLATPGAQANTINPTEQKMRAQNGTIATDVNPDGKSAPTATPAITKIDEPQAGGTGKTQPAPILEPRTTPAPAETVKATLPAGTPAPAPVAAAPAPAASPVAAPAAKPAPTAAPAAASAQVAGGVASDSETIKAETEKLKMSFKDLDGLKKLLNENDTVLFGGNAMPKEKAMTKLIEGNEDHFCKVSGLSKMHKDDYLKLVAGDTKSVDQENDIFLSTLIFENKNGRVEFECNHTNAKFELRDMRVNFSQYLRIHDLEGKTENPKDYINQHTASRLYGAFKIEDTQAINKVKYDEKMDKGFALVNGKIMDGDEAIQGVDEGKFSHACVLMDVKGTLNDKKVFGYARKPLMAKADEKSKNIIVSYAFRADREDGFMMYCHQPKTSGHDEITKAFKGIVKYGMLARREFHKKTVELEKIRVEMQKLLEEKQKAAAAAGATAPSAGSVMTVIPPEKK